MEIVDDTLLRQMIHFAQKLFKRQAAPVDELDPIFVCLEYLPGGPFPVGIELCLAHDDEDTTRIGVKLQSEIQGGGKVEGHRHADDIARQLPALDFTLVDSAVH